MSSISLLLFSVHKNVHSFKLKIQYTEPKIYTGGVEIRQWSKLPSSKKMEALDKKWYLYYSFRDPVSGKLKRQPNIKAGANKFKNKKDRYEFLKTLKINLIILLESGFNPYNYDEKLERNFKELNVSNVTANSSSFQKVVKHVPIEIVHEEPYVVTTIDTAFELALKTKERVLAASSYPKFKSRINQFKVWLKDANILGTDDIRAINKKVVISYLNSVLQKTSARNRNNSRTDIGTLFQILEDNELIVENFVKKINSLKSTPKRNKTYTPKQEADILKYLSDNDEILLLFVKFMVYGYLRPQEVCRLTVGDIDLVDRKLYVQAKNKLVKTKIIPEILHKIIPSLEGIPKDYCLFTPNKIGGVWDIHETSKRDHFTKRFKVVIK